MSFNWAEYLSVAETLSGMVVSGPPAGTEALQRASVSSGLLRQLQPGSKPAGRHRWCQDSNERESSRVCFEVV